MLNKLFGIGCEAGVQKSAGGFGAHYVTKQSAQINRFQDGQQCQCANPGSLRDLPVVSVKFLLPPETFGANIKESQKITHALEFMPRPHTPCIREGQNYVG